MHRLWFSRRRFIHSLRSDRKEVRELRAIALIATVLLVLWLVFHYGLAQVMT